MSSGQGRIIGERNIQGAPDLVVEILSPSTASVDRGRKLSLYERSGVREYWIVDRAARLVEVHVFGSTPLHRVLDDRGVLESALLPGLQIRVAEIFGPAS